MERNHQRAQDGDRGDFKTNGHDGANIGNGRHTSAGYGSNPHISAGRNTRNSGALFGNKEQDYHAGIFILYLDFIADATLGV